jgi:hypothetical protein
MMSEVFINSIEGTIRRAQAYATIYEQVGFKPFYLSDFNDAVDYNHQISSSMMSALHRFHLARKTGNRREYDVFLGEWNGIKHIKKGYSYEWQLEFDSNDSSMLQTRIYSIMLQLKELYGSVVEAHVEAFNMVN